MDQVILASRSGSLLCMSSNTYVFTRIQTLERTMDHNFVVEGQVNKVVRSLLSIHISSILNTNSCNLNKT